MIRNQKRNFCYLLHYTVDCIYPWTHAHKTCFHVTSNVWGSGVKLWSLPTQMWSFTSQHCSEGRWFWSTRKEQMISKASHFQRFAESSERTCAGLCNLTGSTAFKKSNHVRTLPKRTFQDCIKKLRDYLTIQGDWGKLLTSTNSRRFRNKLPSGRYYSGKRLGKYASERFPPENTQCWLFQRQRSFLR